MNAAFRSYEEMAGPGSAVTGVDERLCGTTGTTGTTGAAARRATPVYDENKLSSALGREGDDAAAAVLAYEIAAYR